MCVIYLYFSIVTSAYSYIFLTGTQGDTNPGVGGRVMEVKIKNIDTIHVQLMISLFLTSHSHSGR
jgi:hypothetical protein